MIVLDLAWLLARCHMLESANNLIVALQLHITTSASSDLSFCSVTLSGSLDNPSALPCLAVGL